VHTFKKMFELTQKFRAPDGWYETTAIPRTKSY